MKRMMAVVMSAAMVIAMLAGCGAKKEQTRAQAPTAKGTEAGGNTKDSAKENPDMEPFPISMITPLTGNNTFGGNEYKNGAELAFQHLGGEINGRKVELVIADGPDQDATLSQFERLYNEGSRVFLSGYGSSGDKTFATMCDEMETLYISLNWADNLIQGDSDYFFRTGANVIAFGCGVIDRAVYVGENFLNKNASDLKVAITYNTNLSHVYTPIVERAKELGVQVVLEEGYAVDTKDFVPIINKLKAVDYDIYIPIQSVTDGTPFQKKMYEMSYTPPITLGAGVYYDTPVFAELGNEITNGILTQSYTTPFISETAAPGVTKFLNEYTEQYGHAPLTHALAAYSGMEVIFEILRQMDPSEWEDTFKLGQTTKNIDIPYGQLAWYWGVKFEDNSNTRSDAFILGQWQDGNLKCVGPENLMTSDPVIPWKE